MSIRITLTESQQADLGPLLQKITDAAADGHPGMSMAQLYIGSGEMICGFVNSKDSRKVQVALGRNIGHKTTTPDDRPPEIFSPSCSSGGTPCEHQDPDTWVCPFGFGIKDNKKCPRHTFEHRVTVYGKHRSSIRCMVAE